VFDVRKPLVREDNESWVSRDDLVPEGARRMIAAALEAAVEQYVCLLVGEDGKRLVVRQTLLITERCDRVEPHPATIHGARQRSFESRCGSTRSSTRPANPWRPDSRNPGPQNRDKTRWTS